MINTNRIVTKAHSYIIELPFAIFGSKICAYILVVKVWPSVDKEIVADEDKPLVKNNGAVSAKILPIDKTTLAIICWYAIGKIIFLIWTGELMKD